MLDTIMLRLPWLFVVWMTCVGGAIGSFLNVVVYRMPAGISLSYPPSRCPKCETPIRIYDNIPVVGWLVLSGRCRSCKRPIAARYPIVEATVGVLFGLLAFTTVLRTHANADVLFNFWRFLYYANATACLVALGLIDFDGNRFPRRLIVYAVLTILFTPVIRDEVRVWAMPTIFHDSTYATGRAGSMAILVLHVVWSGFAAFMVSRRVQFASNLILTSALVGVLLGGLTPALPVVIGSVACTNLFGRRSTNDANQSETTGTHRSLFSSAVVMLAAIAYLFILVQMYRGEIVYYWRS